MNKFGDFILRGLRKTYRIVFEAHPALMLFENDPDRASEIIYELLVSDNPCMVARFGSTELALLSNWYGVQKGEHNVTKYIKGVIPQWWWNWRNVEAIKTNSGFFPIKMDYINRFSEMMIRDMQIVDILGCWRWEEKLFTKELEHSDKVYLLCLETYWGKNPWSRALEGKRVLVVHPFAEEITRQYHEHREQLFEDKRVLPKFASLRVVKAVQSLGGDSNGFKDWFEALEWMENQMDSEPYDIALIGCGAYGFPLAAHAKRTGHKAVHLGGALQLLFGIKGKRWETQDYHKLYDYTKLFNEFWIRPDKQNKPEVAGLIENGCYW